MPEIDATLAAMRKLGRCLAWIVAVFVGLIGLWGFCTDITIGRKRG